MRETVNRIKKVMEKAVDWTLVVLFLLIFAVGIAQVVMRALNNPLTWSEELVRLVYIWLCFLGWVVATRTGSHISITMILNKLRPFVQKILKTFNCFLVIVFSVFIIYYGYKLAAIGGINRAIVIPVTFAVVYAIAPISNLIIVFYKILELFTIWGTAKEQPA
jgi:TRAP-type C4-dicarboxylate transport system permease small subunit